MRSSLIFFLVFISLSCSKVQFQSQINMNSVLLTSPENSGTTIPPIDNPETFFEPLAWEAKVSGSNAWSKTVYQVIRNEESQMLGQAVADDVEIFCPNYRSLTDNQRLNFWGQLLAAMSKYESSWNPASYYIESTMGLDPITGRQVASEGLLQLSYQDEKSYGLDCGFDWNLDQQFQNSDTRKTIFNPHFNLRCGIKILARQLKKQRAISTTTGVYWAVLKKNGTYSKVPEISLLTKKLSFCQ